MTAELDPARFARVKELFRIASSLSPPGRASYLAGACGADDALRREVDELLSHALQAQVGFLDAVAHASDPGGGVPVSIPGFRLLELLSSGASGLIYRAEQARPRREVAIKLLRLDTLAPGQVARFQREAEILARLSHPGIAQVFGAGVVESAAGGLPWIAMELVPGYELMRWIELGRPDVRARVTLFASLCDAVQHAHGRGIVHRDLKPSNVLVEEGGRPKVIDFGIARVETDRAASERTRAGLVMGTLAYMSPEQARGELDAVGPSSDVYALGVMLFEALTGELPLDLDAADVVEGARIVCEVEPRRLRELTPDVSSDLETVLLKALDKDPRRRYASAGALGNDLANWLADRPVTARRPTIGYQTRKFVRRNRALTVCACVVILSLVLVILQTRGRLAGEQRGNERMSAVMEVLSGKYFGLSERLGFGDRDRRDAEELIVLVEEQIALDPSYRPLRALLAKALNDLGDLHQGRRAEADAADCYRRALELREALAAEDQDDRESRSHVSRLYAKLGETAREQGDLAERDRWFALALERDEELVLRYPDDLELREDLGWSLDRVACAASERGDTVTALRLRQRRLRDARELVRLEPDNWKFVRNLAHTHYFMIGLDSSADHMAECLRLARREVALRPGARDALIWQAHAERAARRNAPDPESELELALSAYTIALRLVREDPSRIEHVELLRLASLEALSIADTLGRSALLRAMLREIGEQVDICRAQRGLEVFAGLMSSELRFFEAHLSESEGRSDEARALAERGWRELGDAALAGDAVAEDMALCRDLVANACSAARPYQQGLVTRFFEPLLAAGACDRARWLADELARPERLPTDGLAELSDLRRARGF